MTKFHELPEQPSYNAKENKKLGNPMNEPVNDTI